MFKKLSFRHYRIALAISIPTHFKRSLLRNGPKIEYLKPVRPHFKKGIIAMHFLFFYFVGKL